MRRKSRTPIPRTTNPNRHNNVVRRRNVLPVDFDWEIYISSHADLRRAGITTQAQAEDHFLKIGHAENRIYSKNTAPAHLSRVPSEPHQWLLKSLAEKKGVVFTCLSGSYDTLKEPVEVDPNWDYVCFTNEPVTSKVWQIRKIPDALVHLPNAKQARAIKILPHVYLSEYEYSFWIDASILIKRSVTGFVSDTLHTETACFAIPKHPDRICLYEEAKAVKRMNKDKPESVDPQVTRYKKEGYPSNWGLVQSGLIIRKHTQEVAEFCNRWWNEVEKGSKRDQLSFNYVLWKYSIPIRVINPAEFGGIYFHLYSHKGKKEPFPISFRRNYGRLENYLNGKRV